MLTDFQNSFTITLCSKFAGKQSINILRPYTTLQNFCAQKS